jgi:predicted  nucleic acid-binding Zn-ribbon protein
MFNQFCYILSLALLFSSCQEININKEMRYTSLLDSVLFHQQELMDSMDSVKLNYCLQKAFNHMQLLESPSLNDFQKQWLYHEKNAYQKIYSDINSFKKQLFSLEKELKFCKSQIQTLKEDLIHRHFNKDQFNTYFEEEQKALAELSVLTKDLKKRYMKSLNDFDSLESKMQGILNQLYALQQNYEASNNK